MTIVIAGGTGFLGTALRDRLHRHGHRTIVLTRRPRGVDDVRWSADAHDTTWTHTVDTADAVVNLAGESIAGARWTSARKAALRDSRMTPTRSLVSAIRSVKRPPPLFISSSAVGIYGPRDNEPKTEDSPAGSDFLAGICREWEALAQEATTTSRVVLLRTGLVLARNGGALPQLALPFRLFAGGPVGTGRQHMSWIHVADWIGLVHLLLESRSNVSGPINLTAPEPVTNEAFAKSLGKVLRRPAFLRTPAFALRLILGEMADELILGGQRAIPARARALGYEFKYSRLESALQEIYG